MTNKPTVEDNDERERLEFFCGVTGAVAAAHGICCAVFAALSVIDIVVR